MQTTEAAPTLERFRSKGRKTPTSPLFPFSVLPEADSSMGTWDGFVNTIYDGGVEGQASATRQEQSELNTPLRVTSANV